MAFVSAMALDDLWIGEMRGVRLGATSVLLARLAEDAVVAFEDRCAHLGVPLSPGTFEHGVITCPVHMWQYDAASGEGVNPTGVCLRRFAVRLGNGQVQVDV